MALNLLSVGASALAANYAALQTTSNNIANATTAGYSRQRVVQQTATPLDSGHGFLGQGVDIAGVERAHDAFLSREALSTQSQAALDSTRLTLLTRLEDAFPTGSKGIGMAATSLFNAFSDLASAPGDNAARQAVLQRADELAKRFASAGTQVETLQAGVTSDLKNSVGTINGLARGIAEINTQILKLQGASGGQPPNDLLDQRDQLVQQLAGFLPVTTYSGDNGTMGVYLAGGQALVDNGQAQTLLVQADTLDARQSALALRGADGRVTRLDSAAVAGSGSVGALLRFQSQDLVSARNQLGQMATALSARMNEQQSYGLDLRNPPGAGQALFTDFVAQSQAGALPGRAALTNARDAVGNPLGTATVKIDDASLLEAEDYLLEADGGGGFVMTRRSDGERFTTTDGSTFTRANPAPGQDASFKPGFHVDIGGAPAAGDRFLLQPVAGAAANMARVLTDPKGVAAAAPYAATAAAANTGTVKPAGLSLSAGFDATQRLQGTLTFTNAGGDYQYSWTRTDANGAVVATGTDTGTWTSGQALSLGGGGYQLQLTGQPAANDAIGIASTRAASTNNGNAGALSALRDVAMVGVSSSSAGRAGGATVTDAYANAMAGVGLRVQGAKTASQISTAVADRARSDRDSQSGVSLDEEGARLIQYQQSYQAAAKVLQAAQSVFDTLLQAINN